MVVRVRLPVCIVKPRMLGCAYDNWIPISNLATWCDVLAARKHGVKDMLWNYYIITKSPQVFGTTLQT